MLGIRITKACLLVDRPEVVKPLPQQRNLALSSSR